MRRATKDVWRERVDAWTASGMTCKDFAREAGVEPTTLAWWKWKLRQQEKRAKPPRRTSARRTDAFVDVTEQVLAAVAPLETSFVVRVHRAEIEVPSSFDADAFGRLLGVLEARR